jgi:Protein of unknown function (DUF2523)
MATGLGGFLSTIAGPIARKVMVGLGVGTVTFLGLQTALNAAISAASSAYGSLAAVPAAFLAMSGFNTAIGIILGALVARLALVQLKRFQLQTS